MGDHSVSGNQTSSDSLTGNIWNLIRYGQRARAFHHGSLNSGTLFDCLGRFGYWLEGQENKSISSSFARPGMF